MTDIIPNRYLGVFESERLKIQLFMNTVRDFFVLNPVLNAEPGIVHSVKCRIKDPRHLLGKVARKNSQDPLNPILPENLLARVTDLAGVRVLHLYQQQYRDIAREIDKQISSGDWCLYEPPKAYTWDPEARAFFESMNLAVVVKESSYTSVHYVVKPRVDSPITCEIQVRTLFEEIWGEVDHALNYPEACKSIACVEQLRVLSKLVGAGSRLGDAILRTYLAWKDPIETLRETRETRETREAGDNIHANSDSKSTDASDHANNV